MAASDIAILTQDDIPAAHRLSQEAGWAQTVADWRAFVELGTVRGIRQDGALVATGATMPYAAGGFGFVSMVLVTAAERRRGLATRLVSAGIAELRQHALVPVLDATPAGQPVYQRLGFQEMFALDRWAGPGLGQAPAGPEPANPATADGMARLDAGAFGADRPALLHAFLGQPGVRTVMRPSGFALARPAMHATHLGPIVAGNVRQAASLLRAMLRCVTGPALLDVPARWGALAALLAGLGFRRQRSFLRMGLGRATPFGDPNRLFAVAGPEFG